MAVCSHNRVPLTGMLVLFALLSFVCAVACNGGTGPTVLVSRRCGHHFRACTPGGVLLRPGKPKRTRNQQPPAGYEYTHPSVEILHYRIEELYWNCCMMSRTAQSDHRSRNAHSDDRRAVEAECDHFQRTDALYILDQLR